MRNIFWSAPLLLALLAPSACRLPHRGEAPPIVPPTLTGRPARSPLRFEREVVADAGLEKIDALCRDLVETDKTPGIVLLIGQGDRVLFRQAYGWRMREPREEPMTVDTLFDLASLTKPLCTAPAILLLAQDGHIDLDKPVAHYLPAFNRPDKAPITLAHLLTHTSGLPAYTSADRLRREAGPRPQPDALIAQIAGLPLAGSIGGRPLYSCLNYLTLAQVVRQVTGERQEWLLRRRLWGPLEMRNTAYHLNRDQLLRTAPTIHQGDLWRRGEVHDPLAWYSASALYSPGNAGVFATADDVARQVRMLLNGGALDGQRIFGPEALAWAIEPQAGDWTFGWEVARNPAYRTERNDEPGAHCLIHTGYTGTLVWMDLRTGTYLIFLSNSVYPDDNRARKQEVIIARREMVRILLDHMAAYSDIRPESPPEA